MKIHIKNGRLIDPANGIDASRMSSSPPARIVGVGSAPDGFTPARTIDASGLVVAPA
jgi:dihydroorotase